MLNMIIRYKIQFLISLLLIICVTVRAQKQSEKRPNIVVVFTDDQTYRAIGYNNNLIKTPNLDYLASQGIIFKNTFAATPICAASRASIMTGVYPQTNGTVSLNSKAFLENIVEKKAFKTLPNYLNDAGYATYFSGKSHLGDPKNYGFQFGEEKFDVKDSTAFIQAFSFLQSPSINDKPFFLWLAPRQPHVPLRPNQKWLDLYDGIDFPTEPNFLENPLSQSFFNQGIPGENFYRDSKYIDNYKNLPSGPPRSAQVIKDFTKAYYATISHLDSQIGELITQLKNNNLLDNTIIIFLADNGYFLGNHGLGNKITMHEESVHIPMVVSSPLIKNKGTVYPEVTSSIDVFPTILDLAGVAVPKYLQGKSFVNVVKKGSTAKIQDYVVSEAVGVGGELGTGHRMVRSKKWKYILSDTNDEALFDLENDPYELNNIFSPNHKAVPAMKKRLAEWKRVTGDKKDLK